MIRSCWTLLLVVVAGPVAAKEPEIPVRKLTITPAAAPVPALRYELLPELRDTTPGNAALLYYRAFSPEWWGTYQRDKTMADKLYAAQTAPLSDLKKHSADIDWVRNSQMLKEVDRAARRSYCDWEMAPRIREEGISMLLPDVQSLRQFGLMLSVRARLEMADGRFDKTVYTLQTGLQLGRHTAHGPTLIQALVGAAIINVMMGEVEEWVGTPGSPNLYWALTSLPQPFVDLRMGFQGEKLMLENLLPGFREGLAAGHMRPLTLATLRDMVARLTQISTESSPSPIIVAALVAMNYAPAKQFLKERGWSAAEIEALPAIQAVLLHEAATYDRLYDEMLKWQGLPYSIARPGLEQADRELRKEVVRSGHRSLASLLLPAVTKVCVAQARTDRNINVLRTIEALRLFAADHGKLPEKLADITEVPIPIDPFTGQPLDYRLDGDHATLTVPPPAGQAAFESNSRRFEITLKK